MATLSYPIGIADAAASVAGALRPAYTGARVQDATAAAARDYRLLADTRGTVSDQVLYRATPTSPEAPFANGRVWLLRLADGYKAWEGWSDAQGRYTATGLEVGVEYVAVGIDPHRHYKATGAGPVRAQAA